MKAMTRIRAGAVAAALVVGGTWVASPSPASAQIDPGYFLGCNFLVDPIGCVEQIIDGISPLGVEAQSLDPGALPGGGTLPSTPGANFTAPDVSTNLPTFDFSDPQAPVIPGIPSIEELFANIAEESEASSSPFAPSDIALFLGLGLAALAARSVIVRRGTAVRATA